MGQLKVLLSVLLTTSLALAGMPAFSPDDAAPDITSKCSFAVSSNTEKKAAIRDGRHDTAWAPDNGESPYVQVALPEGAAAGFVYIMWNEVPQGWQLLESSDGSVWSAVELGEKENFINACVPLSGNAIKFRIESTSVKWKMSVAELKVYGKGALPADVQVWQPSPEKADLMVIPAHPDDELIYFGGTLPYYAGELNKHTVVVYMTSSPIIRKFEALNGLWKAGVREYPVFLPLANKYSSTVEDAEIAWDGLDNAVSLLAEQMRRFKPEVVVTHDLDGEYGHGAHKLTALAVEKAVDAGNDAGLYPDSAERYGIWQVKKCYLHLYPKNKIEMDWNKPLEAFGGKTALDMAKAGYDLHVSQHFRDRPIDDSGEYDNAAYGLYFTSVGPDKEGGDFFEHIAAPSPSPVKTAAQPASPRPSPSAANTPGGTTAEPAETAEDDIPAFSGRITPSGSAGATAGAAAGFLLLFALAVVIHNRSVMKLAKHARKTNF